MDSISHPPKLTVDRVRIAEHQDVKRVRRWGSGSLEGEVRLFIKHVRHSRVCQISVSALLWQSHNGRFATEKGEKQRNQTVV